MHTPFTGFAVFDLETTGISVGRHHRVIEIGIVRLDEDLAIVEEWETLINPGRDIGAYDIHGISASDLRDAPTFSDLIADIWHRFEGAVPVTHNFSFDKRFILAEFARAGVELGEFDGICTMRLASECGMSGGHRRRLVDLCDKLREAEEKAQRALSMAQQTKAGHVYVISNIGSFGNEVFKIGMTRRLEPLDRVRELGDASVPFPFDVHMMISCDDAPTLENTLHKAFNSRRLNKVNLRREFFRVDLDEIRKVVEERHGEVDYVADPDALQHRDPIRPAVRRRCFAASQT